MIFCILIFFSFAANATIIEIGVPDYTNSRAIYVTGNIKELCHWKAKCLKVSPNHEGRYLLNIQSKSSFFFKVTLGDWNSEAIKNSGHKYQNQFVESASDYKYFKVDHWLSDKGRFEDQVKEYEKLDRVFVPKKPIIFVGSSSIRLWDNFYEDLSGFSVLKRGIGGATTKDINIYKHRLIYKYNPQKVFVYVGENDISEKGASVEETFQKIKHVLIDIAINLPNSEIYYISIKPSIERFQIISKIKELNNLIKSWQHKNRFFTYINVFDSMMDGETVRDDIWKEDNLHMNQRGYDLWLTQILPYLAFVSFKGDTYF